MSLEYLLCARYEQKDVGPSLMEFMDFGKKWILIIMQLCVHL